MAVIKIHFLLANLSEKLLMTAILPFFSSDGKTAESTSGKLLFFLILVYTKQQ